MNIDRSLFDKNVIAPYLVEQLRSTVHTLGVCHEKMQQAKLRGTQFKRLAVAENTVSHGIEAQAFDLDGVFGHLRRTATQDGLDAG